MFTAIKRVIASTKRDPGGGWITADTLLDGKLVTLACAYAPPDSRVAERPAFFDKLAIKPEEETIDKEGQSGHGASTSHSDNRDNALCGDSPLTRDSHAY